MKKLFAILFSFQLILAPVALAQDKASSDPADQFRANPDAKGSAMNMTSMMKSVMAIGTGVIGTNVLITCKLKAPSTLLLAAGGAVFILSEMMGGKAHADYLKKQTADLKIVEDKLKSQGGGGEVQRESLQAALDSEKETLKFINKRKMWTMLVGAVYAAGAAASAMEHLIPGTQIPLGCDTVTAEGAHKLTTAAMGAAYSYMAGGMAAGLVAGLALYMTSAGHAHHLLLNTATTRIVFFGVASAIQAVTMMDLSKRAGIAKENVSKLEKALADFDKNSTATNGIATADPNAAGNGDVNSIPFSNSSAIKKLPTSTLATSSLCGGSSPQGFTVSEKSCTNPARFSDPKFGAEFQSPTLTSFGQNMADTANQLAGGNIGAAEVGAASLAAQAGRMNQIRDNAIKKMNDTLKAQGKKPIDVDGEVNRQLASMSNAMKNSNPSASAALASMAGGKANLGDDIKGEADVKGAVQNIKAGDNNSAAVGAATTNDLSLDGSLDSDLAPIDESAKVAELMKTDDFEYAKNDISDKKETSIFNMVSSRYILNYNKFFKKDEEPAAKKPSLEK